MKLPSRPPLHSFYEDPELKRLVALTAMEAVRMKKNPDKAVELAVAKFEAQKAADFVRRKAEAFVAPEPLRALPPLGDKAPAALARGEEWVP